ncbi:MAG: hypothetical protein LC750_01180 [Actinobacteria bacterium]|nr:hypothetical protein [Actinomycetota bacterium]
MPNISERISLECETIDVAEIVTHRPSDWMLPFFRIASEEGDQIGVGLRSAMRSTLVKASSPKNVHVEIGEPRQVVGGAIEVPFRWRATGYQSLFSMFDGRLVVWASARRKTQLAVEGVSDVPAEITDDVLGATAAMRATEAAARSLLSKLKVALEELLRTQRR